MEQIQFPRRTDPASRGLTEADFTNLLYQYGPGLVERSLQTNGLLGRMTLAGARFENPEKSITTTINVPGTKVGTTQKMRFNGQPVLFEVGGTVQFNIVGGGQVTLTIKIMVDGLELGSTIVSFVQNATVLHTLPVNFKKMVKDALKLSSGDHLVGIDYTWSATGTTGSVTVEDEYIMASNASFDRRIAIQ